MWLLNTHTITLRNFVADIPEYVILSHTWEQEEVTFDDISKPAQRANMKGYAKIIGCCRQAVHDGFEWAWIDTCCIDKRSSAELSEAINSMYKWYWNAAICYAYLEDTTGLQAIGSSRWFTRGWTLQELLAPSLVEFYTQSWSFVGTKAGLLEPLGEITRIDKRYLRDRRNIRFANIATKFSWVSRRETTRQEDIAYCLLGLVGINMPMMYGEGPRAFRRLQLEILRKTNDHTIFVWETPQNVQWRSDVQGVLALWPSCFEHSAGIDAIRARRPTESLAHDVTNNGLRITLPTIRKGYHNTVALLQCKNSEGRRLGIPLRSLEDDNQQHGRSTTLDEIVACEESEAESGDLSTLYLLLDNEALYAKHTLVDSSRGQDMCAQIKDVRGDCGYHILNTVLESRTGLSDIEVRDRGWVKVHKRQDICLSLATTAWNLKSISIRISFQWGHPVFEVSGSTGIERLRVVLNNCGQRTVIELRSKKRLKLWRQIWVISVQISKCYCSPKTYPDSNPPACTCVCESPPSFEVDEDHGMNGSANDNETNEKKDKEKEKERLV